MVAEPAISALLSSDVAVLRLTSDSLMAGVVSSTRLGAATLPAPLALFFASSSMRRRVSSDIV